MSGDPLSDILRSVRLRGAVFYYVSCRDRWVAETPAASDLAPELGPGAEHVMAYHLVLRGCGWAALKGEAAVRLGAGDIVVFPRGDAHVLSSAPGMHAPAENSDWRVTIRDAPKPVLLALHDGVCTPGAEVSAVDASAVMVCGFISCDLRPFNPLVEALPRLLHLSASTVGAWVAPMLGQAVAESRHRPPGSAALLEHVSEIVFVDAARRHLESLPEGGGTGWLSALRERHVGRAIGLMHEYPAEDWTVEELGRRVGLSRSALHERFLATVGMPPMHYLANWRMQVGARLLREGDATVATVAQEIGYESEAAFARAFKRRMGQSPAAWRRAQRASP